MYGWYMAVYAVTLCSPPPPPRFASVKSKWKGTNLAQEIGYSYCPTSLKMWWDWLHTLEDTNYTATQWFILVQYAWYQLSTWYYTLLVPWMSPPPSKVYHHDSFSDWHHDYLIKVEVIGMGIPYKHTVWLIVCTLLATHICPTHTRYFLHSNWAPSSTRFFPFFIHRHIN